MCSSDLVKAEDLIRHYPRLFHVTEAGAWRSIAANGLMTTAQIVSTSALNADDQAQILTRPRPRWVPVIHPELGSVSIRDQAPLRAHILEKVLQGMSVEEWVGMLNERVFFWLSRRRLEQLLVARNNRRRPHDVLVVDTASLVSRYRDQIRLSAVNSGATLYPGAPVRGHFTFLTIEDYPYEELRRRRSPGAAVAELTVLGGVSDIASHVITVERHPAAAA